ncbi:hypothetical protein [Micromonospora musae]|uniref:Uncharacterized protein n=1 Tax=Micromonospora musae TaxID=1894970 RepID=A0A3A9XLV3_9ACTN|nr:hypothetical protein [Micromonospora musae]RKN26190.1 hypothetical protein D7044_30645 [Micromonospora musae]
MTTPTVTNVAQGDAHVDLQAGVVHGDINFYRLSPNATPEEQFDEAVKYLRARVRDEARTLIEKAFAGGCRSTKVQFFRMIALLSGRTLRQLGAEELDRLEAIYASLPDLDEQDEWAAGLQVIIHLLAPDSTTDPDLMIKEIDALRQIQRDWIYGHLEALLEGTMQDEMWKASVTLARARRTANDRATRVWKFFHPKPAQPRVQQVRPSVVPLRDWLRAGVGAVLFTLAVVQLTLLAMAGGELAPAFGLLAGLGGLAAFCVGGADRHYRRARLRAKDAELLPPRQRREAPPDGFARDVDRQFDRYFGRYVPRGTERTYWLQQTAGIRRRLRDEVVELYREQRIHADRVAWLVRYLVSDVRKQWEENTLTAYRHQLRVPAKSTILHLGGLISCVASTYWVLRAAVQSAPLPGTAWFLLAVVSAVPALRSSFRIVAERRRVAAEAAERAEEDIARWAAYERWQRKLSDKPSDIQMATWLESDRKVLVDAIMQKYRLRPSQVIAHTFLEAPANSCRRARYPRGPWRYSRYQLLLFLLTDDGVRQVNIDLDFETAESRTTQRLNYRFDAVAAVRIDGIAAQRQTFELTLVNGDPITIPVSESSDETLEPDEERTKITELSLDAAGLNHTLHVLEGIAAEGKEWIRHRRRRADERLSNLASNRHGPAD